MNSGSLSITYSQRPGTGQKEEANMKVLKSVEAIPMCARAAYTQLGQRMPDYLDGDQEGYLVEGQWFNEAEVSALYTVEPTGPKPRLVAEITELRDKTEKLSRFLSSPSFEALDDENRDLLITQLDLHQQLLSVLTKRLTIFRD